jgi:hypothetical protein
VINNRPSPGWVVRLDIPRSSLIAWQHQLQPPFYPYVERVGDGEAGTWVLRSDLFDGLGNAEEVRGRAVPLIEQLNGAQRLGQDVQPVRFNGVGHIDDNGKLSITVFAEGYAEGNAISIAVAEVRDAQGNLIVAPPRASEMQRWLQAAQANDDVADLLRYVGSADNWYDLYKAFEMVEAIAGDLHKLRKILGRDAARYRVARQNANFYRHARESRPSEIVSLKEARSVLVHSVRFIATRVLDRDQH